MESAEVPNNQWIDKENMIYIYIYVHMHTHIYMHTHTPWLNHKKNEIILFAEKCMELEIIMLSKIKQAQKTKHHMFSLICGT
jgi:hypothetical protein